MAFNGDGPHSKRQRLEESGHRVSTLYILDSAVVFLFSSAEFAEQFFFVGRILPVIRTVWYTGTVNACVSACRVRFTTRAAVATQRRGESRHLSGRFYPYHRHRVETMGDARALEGDCLVSWSCRV